MSNEDTVQYREFLTKLQREDQRPAALKDIKNLFVFKPPGEAANTIKNVGISKIVHCLNAPDKYVLPNIRTKSRALNRTETDLACEVLKVCFDQLNTGDMAKHYTGHLMYLLRHEKDCVRRLAIDEIHKTVTADPTLLPVPEFIDIFVAVSQLVTDKDMGVANRAIVITSNLPVEAYPKVLEEMKIALEDSSSSKCNAFEVIINISTKSYELFKLSADMNYIDFMVDDLQSNDVLYQLNILELLSRLVVTTHGINYLVKKGTLENISKLLKDLSTNPLGGLLTPGKWFVYELAGVGYMKFFGCIAHHYPKEIFNKYPVLLDMLFDAFQTEDPTVLPVALDTLGYIGETVEGKLCLAALGGKYIQAVDQIGNIIRNSPTEMKVRAIHCLASLISIDKDLNKPKTGPVDHRVTLMTREWFRSLSTSPSAMEALFTMCKNPFPDIRLGAFTLLDSVCQHQWGEELVARTAGFIEYLLDRSVDHMKSSKEAKYDVVKRLSNSPAFDAAIIMRLQTYVEQGPFYSETQMEVAMEEGD